MTNNKEHIFTLEKKVSEKHIDKIIDKFYRLHLSNKEKKEKYIFDFSDVEWIANQELLILTGLFKYLILDNIPFKVFFLKNGSSSEIDIRKAKQFIQIWDVWKIYQVIPHMAYNEYFDIDGNSIDRLKLHFNIKSNTQEIYERYGVTPFVCLNKIDNYDDRIIRELLDKVYLLNDATNEILRENNCILPFENETFSSIITKELYENFLDHFINPTFHTESQYAFLSVSLKRKLDEQQNNAQKIQSILKRNFEDETIPELKNLAFDSKSKEFKNQSLLELSFLDFGGGISSTLRSAYDESDKNSFSSYHFERHIDTRVLEYAFRYDSSRHQLSDRYKEGLKIPRGLFDLLSIVKRFEGWLIARSNYGKVAFNFTSNKSFSNSVQYFGDELLYFPGTLISIYIPERNLEKKFDTSSIKPYDLDSNLSFVNNEVKYISIFELQQKLKDEKLSKDLVYENLFKLLIKELNPNDKNALIYLDFKGFEIDERITKKIIYFLISDYRINLTNNVIVLNPPPKVFLNNIQKEIIHLSEIDRHYKIHPTPFINISDRGEELEVFWLGIYSEGDIKKLNDLLLEDHDLRSSDFENPLDIVGHINTYDKYGNLKSIIDSKTIIEFYKQRIKTSQILELDRIILPCVKKEPNTVFLCNGNYYQYEYLQLFDILSNFDKREYLSNILFNTLKDKLEKIEEYIFISITSSSQKILEYFILKQLIKRNQCIILENYHSFENENAFKQGLKYGNKIVLICDVISTGYMTKKLESSLNNIGSTIHHIGVLVDAIDTDFESEATDYNWIRERISSVYVYKMKKYRRKEISEKLINGNLSVIRINPFTNTPITQSLSESNYINTVLLTNKEFIDLIAPEYIKAGYFKFNNLIHPYFFDMNGILNDENISKRLLNKLINEINYKHSLKDLDIIVYPKNSGVNSVNHQIIRDEILKNQKIDFFELERFSLNEGWRFPHPPQYLKDICKNKYILILDDGSCSGESIIQMIDEVAFLDVKEIVVLSIIGRVTDHKREFFSRLKTIQNSTRVINTTVFFGSHWHIPTYYIEQSPVTKEREWLDEIIRFTNTPSTIKRVASEVRKELVLKDVKEGNNKFLLKCKDGTEIIDELILFKEEIGKTTEFRFYKEYFDFFNLFISRHESRDPKKRGSEPYREIELICAVFLHEPYLYERVKIVLPDLINKIEVFVQTIFWGNPEFNGNPRLEKKKLYYHWDNKNLIHLLFIVFKNEHLFSLLESKNFTKIVQDFAEKPSDVDYLLFKLCSYLPLNNSNNIENQHIESLKRLIDIIIELNEVDKKIIRKLKRFRSFTSSLLSTNDDFNALLNSVKLQYSKLTDDRYHKESMSVQFDIIQTQLEILSNNYKEETERTIIKTWEKITPFIDSLLTFSKSYPDYFYPFGIEIYSNLELSSNSLRKRYGEVSDLIFSLDINSRFEKIREFVKSIYTDFIISESIYFNIFQNTVTPDFLKEYLIFKDKLKAEYAILKLEEYNPINIDQTIGIPLLMTREIVFGELLNNLRHADLNFPVYLDWKTELKTLVLTIKNKPLNNSNLENGGGSGIDKLVRLNKIPNQLISYRKFESSTDFIQEIRFKIV